MFRNEWIPRIILSSLCLLFGIRLLFAGQLLVAEYQSWGVSELLMRTAGAAQILAAFGIWYRRFRTIFIVLLAVIVAAALFVHMKFQHSLWSFLPAALICLFIFLDLSTEASESSEA